MSPTLMGYQWYLVLIGGWQRVSQGVEKTKKWLHPTEKLAHHFYLRGNLLEVVRQWSGGCWLLASMLKNTFPNVKSDQACERLP